ncbi:YceI family protein [Robertkochia aurantiaca]|uniref:YceI family protein n=1 Tax=Robertkochia aurantiaca TaxID=2873700 RepID=UPI001CC93E46|nr:YceI family protein [Robertkochia sp. 3YJGBD-33]
MKKAVSTTLAIVLALAVSAFTNPIEEKKVDTTKSKVTWKGYKVTGSHEGTVQIKSGALQFDGELLTGGNFVVDMTSLIATDLEGEYKGKLEGHLKSDDFFGVANYPTASLDITTVKQTGKNAYEVTGDLTIKEQTHPVTFDLSVYGSKATANVKVDRTKYGVKYGSGSFFDNLGDKTIYDEFDLVVDLEF